MKRQSRNTVLNSRIAVAALSFASATAAIAGNGDHGGNAVPVGGGYRLYDLVKNEAKYLNPDQLPEVSVNHTYAIMLRMIQLNFSRHTGLHVVFPALRFRVTRTSALDKIRDEGAIPTYWQGKLRQVAAQKDGEVLIDGRILDQMPPLDQHALITHEYLIALALKHSKDLHSPVGTEPISSMVELMYSDLDDGIIERDFWKFWAQLPTQTGSRTIQQADGTETRIEFVGREVRITNPRAKLDRTLNSDYSGDATVDFAANPLLFALKVPAESISLRTDGDVAKWLNEVCGTQYGFSHYVSATLAAPRTQTTYTTINFSYFYSQGDGADRDYAFRAKSFSSPTEISSTETGKEFAYRVLDSITCALRY